MFSCGSIVVNVVQVLLNRDFSKILALQNYCRPPHLRVTEIIAKNWVFDPPLHPVGICNGIQQKLDAKTPDARRRTPDARRQTPPFWSRPAEDARHQLLDARRPVLDAAPDARCQTASPGRSVSDAKPHYSIHQGHALSSCSQLKGK